MPDGLLILLGVALIALTDAASIGHAGVKATDCHSEIYCTGELLKTVQLAEIFPDSKSFVDLHQINDPEVTLSNFYRLMNETDNKPSRSQIRQYVNDNFASSSELIDWTLPDWTENPSILKRIQETKYREWAKHLNEIWKDLARKASPEVAKYPERHSLIYVNNGFIIPGGRFKEFYYWDSYWVIEGLLLSDMYQTAKGIIDNFLYMVEKYGFIPNGGRIYYLMRSQPPLLHLMVSRYLEITRDYEYLRKIISTLEKEFAFWQREKMIDVEKDGKIYKMGHYVVHSTRPRPESFKEDYLMAQNLPEKMQDFFYNNIKAGAESGWDFSNRWYIGNNKSGMLSLLNISTQYIIPVDLNAILQQNARLLNEFHTLLGNNAKSQYYMKIAGELQMAIDNVLWNEESGIWLDYDVKNERSRNMFYPSNLTPLYTKSYNRLQRERYALSAVKYLKLQKVDSFLGGTPSSLNHTGEQWDFPNAWPPLQSFIVMGLYRTGVSEAMEIAHELASRWLASNYLGYAENGYMFEKYDSVVPGHGGGGGEYHVQTGFGWTNGVVLEFLNTFSNIKVGEVAYESDLNTDIGE
ncbi:PREDICTED: trehalase-like [Eufriesea mexicana]|uniref:trehalase-like n=1 Tax=Eufriesea mexicana TaxID=516756 RepID=UPI00083C00D6|nr:PREDICTED: trehalase-like [Eufriesea mexicana]